MTASPATDDLLRDGALEGLVIVVARLARAGEQRADTADGASVAAGRCRALGARVFELGADASDEDARAAGVAGIMGWHGAIDVLVNDMAGGFEAAVADGVDGITALRETVDAAWASTRAVANAAFIPDSRGGRVVTLAPARRPGPDPGREAARAAAENMARTLSIEWSRYAIRTTALLLGERTSSEEVSGLIAFLASAGGDYYSGCAFTLGGA